MKAIKIISFVLLALLATQLVPVAAAAPPRVFPTNHYMAKDIVISPADSSSTNATLPGIVVRSPGPVTVKTYDQFTCLAGNHELVLRIVKNDDNTVIATTQPIQITAPNDGFVHTQPAVWQVVFPSVGWYRHEVIVNNTPIAYYHFIVSFGL